MLSILKTTQDNQNIVSIYSNKDDSSKFMAGFVLDVNESSILIGHVSPSGKYDGYIVQSISDIYLIETNGKCETKLEKLYSLQNQKHSTILNKYENLYSSLLHFAKEMELIVSLELINSEYDDVIGFISSINENRVTVRQINSYGEDDGIAYIMMPDITRICCDSNDESPLKILFTMNL